MEYSDSFTPTYSKCCWLLKNGLLKKGTHYSSPWNPSLATSKFRIDFKIFFTCFLKQSQCENATLCFVTLHSIKWQHQGLSCNNIEHFQRQVATTSSFVTSEVVVAQWQEFCGGVFTPKVTDACRPDILVLEACSHFSLSTMVLTYWFDSHCSRRS